MNINSEVFTAQDEQNSKATKTLSLQPHWNNDPDNELSDDMFSEEDHYETDKLNTPHLSQQYNSISDVNHMISPIFSQPQNITPGKPSIPKTPLSLAPLISKCNESWNSDLQTPKGDVPYRTFNSTEQLPKNITETGTPVIDKLCNEDADSNSPVFINKRKTRTKRCIFKTATNEDVAYQTNLSADIHMTPSNEKTWKLKENIHLEFCTNVNASSKDLEPVQLEDKVDSNEMRECANTSTQDFFNNASFSVVDKLCLSSFENKELCKVKSNPISDCEKNKTEGIETTEDDDLKRLRNIKENVKHFYLPHDFKDANIPTEFYSKEIKDLELAERYSKPQRSSLVSLPSGLMTATQLVKLDSSIVKDTELDNLSTLRSIDENVNSDSNDKRLINLATTNFDEATGMTKNLELLKTVEENKTVNKSDSDKYPNTDTQSAVADVVDFIENLGDWSSGAIMIESDMNSNNESETVRTIGPCNFNDHKDIAIKNEQEKLNAAQCTNLSMESLTTEVKFLTAGGKNIDINKAALLKAEKLFQNIESEIDNESLDIIEQSSHQNSLQNDKRDAPRNVAKIKQIFQNEDNELKSINENMEIVGHTEFLKTAVQDGNKHCIDLKKSKYVFPVANNRNTSIIQSKFNNLDNKYEDSSVGIEKKTFPMMARRSWSNNNVSSPRFKNVTDVLDRRRSLPAINITVGLQRGLKRKHAIDSKVKCTTKAKLVDVGSNNSKPEDNMLKKVKYDKTVETCTRFSSWPVSNNHSGRFKKVGHASSLSEIGLQNCSVRSTQINKNSLNNKISQNSEDSDSELEEFLGFSPKSLKESYDYEQKFKSKLTQIENLSTFFKDGHDIKLSTQSKDKSHGIQNVRLKKDHITNMQTLLERDKESINNVEPVDKFPDGQCSSKRSFCGFKIAKEKDVNISKETFAKLKNNAISNEISNIWQQEVKATGNKQEKALLSKDKNGTSENLSHENLDKTIKLSSADFESAFTVTMLENSQTKHVVTAINSDVSNNRSCTIYSPFLGFEPISDRSLKLSQEILRQAEKEYKEISDVSAKPVTTFSSSIEQPIKSMNAFKKVSVKPVKCPLGKSTENQGKQVSQNDDKASEGLSNKSPQNLQKFSTVDFVTDSNYAVGILKNNAEKTDKTFPKELDEVSKLAQTSSKGCNTTKPQKIETFKNDNVSFDVGFFKASGHPISISIENVEKAKRLLLTDLVVPPELLDNGDSSEHYQKKSTENQGKQISQNDDDKTPEGLSNKSPQNLQKFSTVDFVTDSNYAVGILKNNAEKTDKTFSKDLDEVSKLAQTSSKDCNTTKQQKIEPFKNDNVSFDVGFFKASGHPISISIENVEKAKRLLLTDLVVPPELLDNGDSSENYEKESAEKVASRLITNRQIESKASERVKGESVNTFKNSVNNISEAMNYRSEDTLNDLLLKRKMNSFDNSTPLGRNQMTKFKKLRTGTDIQVRKLFSDVSQNENEKEDKNLDAKQHDATFMSIVANNPKNTEEIVKNIPESTLNNTEQNMPTSPIIGSKTRFNKRTRYKKKVVKQPLTRQDEKTSITNNNDTNTKREDNPISATFDSAQQITNICFGNCLEDRLSASLLQDKMIRDKKRIREKPIKGVLLDYKIANKDRRVSWRQVTGGLAPIPKSAQELAEQCITLKVLDVTASNASSYIFDKSEIVGEKAVNQNVISVDISGVRLVLDEHGCAGISEFTHAFLTMAGVDPSLIPLKWIDNHYRWIVWKLASIDRMKCGTASMPRALTPCHVMQQLKYRYDREIDNSERSALRKILEKDDVPSKRMVLCVTNIRKCTDNDWEKITPSELTTCYPLEVTDGWYSIPVSCDRPMMNYITSGKVREGTKIITYGAELLNCEQGCHPLTKQSNICLKIHTNCTRRAKWDAKLGLQRNAGPIPIKLKYIDSQGGVIGKMTVVIARVYPILYREKTADGQSIYRNARSEEKAVAMFERECQIQAETFYAKAEKDYGRRKITLLDEESNSEHGRQAQQNEMKDKLELQLRAKLPPQRKVTPVLKVRVADEDTTAMMNIWTESDDIVNSFKEGSCITVYNATASGKRCGELQLTSFTRQTQFKSEPTLSMHYLNRMYTPLSDISKPTFNPAYCEFDTIGIVSSIMNAPRGMKNFEVVNLAYPNGDLNSAYLSIYFWQGVSTYGYNNMLTVGSIIACSNLEWRRNNVWSIPAGYCNERTVFSCNPRQAHLREPFENLKKLIKNPMEYVKTCAEEIASEFEKGPMTRQSAGGMPDGITNSAARHSFYYSTQLSTMQSPMSFSSSTKSTPIQRKLEKLSYYGEAPELSPVVLNNSSSRVRSDFKPLQCVSNTKLTKLASDSSLSRT